MNLRKVCRPLAAALLLALPITPHAAEPLPVYVVPNFHPASCGWLTDWSTERNYCANSYFDHLDRVRDDSTYNFALSECNNLIAMLNFQPKRFAELQQRIREGRVELCNAFFLEPTINLSGGEALVKMGVEGLRWQQQVMGIRPRFSWMIDVCGTHEQMAQIVSGLGLDALVYCRLNPSGSTVHWFESPDGTRALALSPGHYLEWRPMFGSKTNVSEKQMQQLVTDIQARINPLPAELDRLRPDAANLSSPPRHTPPGLPVLILGGSGDYNLAPLNPNYPAGFLSAFKAFAPQYDVRFTTPGKYLDAILPELKSGAASLPVVRCGTAFSYGAFWIQNPRVKSWFRRCEQELQAAELFATAASLQGKYAYPAQKLYHGWLELCLNMDRNTLWGAAGGMVFEHPTSWDARDRFESIEGISQNVLQAAAGTLAGSKPGLAVFNSLNWRRQDPARLPVAAGKVCQALPGGKETLCHLELPPASLTGSAPPAQVPALKLIDLPPVIETRFYRIKIDPRSGAILSLKLRGAESELLAGPANVIVAEQPKKKLWSSADQMVERPERNRLADSNQPAKLTVSTGPLATVIETESSFLGGGKLRCQTILYQDYPRIDFETELNDLPDRTVVVAEFPLAPNVREVRRGIPYGFAHAAWPEPTAKLPAPAKGIMPAVRWSHYQTAEAGIALLDQGSSGRELVGNTPLIYLYNVAEKYRGYPNAWLSGAGRHVVRYALVAHAGDFARARIPQMAWEFNQPPLVVPGRAPAKSQSFLETSDNVIVEALRREGGEIELRLAECLGRAGQATVKLNLPHGEAALTDLVGGHRQPLPKRSSYKFEVRPQQIVTLRFRTEDAVSAIQALTDWEPLVPEHKREALRRYLPEVKGHPPAGGQ